MPRSTLTWYISKANKLIKEIKQVPQNEMSILLNISQQTYSYRINHIYPDRLSELIRMLDAAGYEIKEKEN